MIKELNEAVLGSQALDDQTEAMEAGLPYSGHKHRDMVIRLTEINNQLEYFHPQAVRFGNIEMTRKIIFEALPPNAREEYTRLGCRDVTDESEMLKAMEKMEQNQKYTSSGLVLGKKLSLKLRKE